jgi:hypothetical protein
MEEDSKTSGGKTLWKKLQQFTLTTNLLWKQTSECKIQGVNDEELAKKLPSLVRMHMKYT